jgi:thiamine pyrophosphate-dependent acetolactate synthase large subunit-like protein
MQASQESSAAALQAFVSRSGLPYCATFQGPGAWVAPEQFAGRVGLFRNQPGDQLLNAADCVITVGFDAIEFDPILWNSGSYDMVSFQEQAHYGRTAGVQLGIYNVVAFAEAFGCEGYQITSVDQLGPVLREALQQSVPVLIDIPIDYSQNLKLMQNVHQDFIH